MLLWITVCLCYSTLALQNAESTLPFNSLQQSVEENELWLWVHEITEKNADLLKESEWLVLIHPGDRLCGHRCHGLLEEKLLGIAKESITLQKEGRPLKFGFINSTEQLKVASLFDLRQYPSFFIVSKSSVFPLDKSDLNMEVLQQRPWQNHKITKSWIADEPLVLKSWELELFHDVLEATVNSYSSISLN